MADGSQLPQADAAAMARALALMAAVGTVLCVISLVADLTPDERRLLLVGQSVAGLAFAAAVYLLRRRVGPRFFALVGVPGATLQLSAGVVLSEDPMNPAAVLYLAVALFSAYFFSHRVAAAQVGLVAVAYAAALAPIASPAVALDRWMFICGVAVAAAIVVAQLRDRLVTLARTDPLTGLANRRAYAERLAGELQRADREGGEVAVVLLDLDGFKAINDTRGHDAGDDALRAIAATLQGALRPYDVAARTGGDEFAVVLADGGARAAQSLADRVLHAVGTDPDLPALSLGAAVAPHDATTQDALLAAADAALYDAKRSGRGRLRFSRDELASEA